MNIIFLEPDTVLAQTYRYAVESVGYRVRICHSAAALLRALDELTPDLIVLELQLADHSGIELLYEIRSYPEWQAIPVLLHSVVPASSLQQSRPTLNTLGVSGYLYKPQTNLGQLLAMIDHILQTVKA